MKAEAFKEKQLAGKVLGWVTESHEQFEQAANDTAARFREAREARTPRARIDKAIDAAKPKSLLASPEVQGAFSQ